MGHSMRTAVVVVGACALLTGCFGSSSPEPTASHSHHRRSPGSSPSSTGPSTASSPPTSSATTSPTPGSPTTTAPASVLRFSPKSDGRHSHTCIAVSGSAPVDYVYYPVLIKTSAPVTLDQASVTYADGVQVKGAWVAPSPKYAGYGLIKGWPAPKILTQSTNVQWSKRVPAAGAALDPAVRSYNVFLHLIVYPDALPVTTDGVALTFHETGGAGQSVTWVDHLTFQASC